jgi:hypothetical protein
MSIEKIFLSRPIEVIHTKGGDFIKFGRDIDRRIYQCYEFVTGVNKKYLRVMGRVTIPDHEMINKSMLTRSMGLKMFDQFKNARHDDLMSGDYEVKEKNGLLSITKTPTTFVRHQTLTCPDHGCSFRFKHNHKGGDFWGCASRSLTDCNNTYSADCSKKYGKHKDY